VNSHFLKYPYPRKRGMREFESLHPHQS
jgi:hypothetical protein